MMRKTMQDESMQQQARQYIDRIIDINRRHGMGSEVPVDTYNRAVRATVRAFEHLPNPERSSKRDD